MPDAKGIAWFKEQFHSKIEAAIQGTPFSLDMITAVACQETGHIWGRLRKTQLSVSQILELCVGDTLDSDKGRKAFPRTKADLVAKPRGREMFDIARQALVDMARHIPGFKEAASRPNKFCHGYGIFQFDLQFFLKEPDYFLQKRYINFDDSLEKCIGELGNAQKRVASLKNKTNLADLEMAFVAIAYNTGRFDPSKGLKQGHRPPGGKFYGEQVFDFLRLSKTVPVPGSGASVLPSASPGHALVAAPTPVEASGLLFEVDVRSDPLRLRSEPAVDEDNANVKARLPDGHLVQAVSNKKVNGFLEVETSLLGANLHGFASAQFLKPAKGVKEVPVLTPAPAPPESGIMAVTMPRRPGTVTKRTERATAHSLNEAGQPSGRKGTTADELRAELAAIIDWLAVDKATHLRYQPTRTATFCNIYVHDYCHLAGVYLPRTFWSPAAIEALAKGQSVQPHLGRTIDEQRANDLFRWLRDFGLRFGWRQTGTLTKLQTEVNQGAIGLIVARRKEDGRSGHIVMVVPETDHNQARRNSLGEVIAPLQSQAGAVNFRRGTGKVDWWKGDQFAESAFWLHN
jgi:hypothetical protein